MSKEKTKIYHSFQEAFGEPKPKKKRINKKDQEKFLGVCKVCKSPMRFIPDTNIVCCSNPDCKGFKNKKQTEEDTSLPVFRLLTEKSTNYANYLFS